MSYIKNSWLNLLVLLTSASQLTTPLFATFDDKSQFNNPEIIPAGYTFGIWGIITSLGFLYGIYQVLPNRKNSVLHSRISRLLFTVYILFSVWIFAAEQDWLIITIIVFVCMFSLLTIAFREILREKIKLNLFEKIVLETQVALYTGWSTVAIFANTAAALKYYGIFNSYSATGNIIQVIILFAALGNSIYFIIKFHYNYFYIATILWAFTGVFFGLEEKSADLILKIVSIGAIASILLLLIASFWHRSKLINKHSS